MNIQLGATLRIPFRVVQGAEWDASWLALDGAASKAVSREGRSGCPQDPELAGSAWDYLTAVKRSTSLSGVAGSSVKPSRTVISRKPATCSMRCTSFGK